jgi:SAM-dependent methyltransferase
MKIRWLVLLSCLVSVTGCASLADQKPSAGVVFVTTPHEVVDEMLRLAAVTRNDVVYDLGSGDGRIVIAAARDFGARAVGVDIDQQLIKESEQNARIAGVSDRVRFVEQDLFRIDLSEATVVTCFLLPGLNEMLAPKLMEELPPGARIVSHMFDMGEWLPDKTVRVGESTIYLWVRPAPVAGSWQINITGAEELSPLALFMRQTFQKITGTATLKEGKTGLSNPRVEGDRLTFVVAGTMSGHEVRMSFSGTVRDNRAEGSVEVQGGPHTGMHKWKAQRTP